MLISTNNTMVHNLTYTQYHTLERCQANEENKRAGDCLNVKIQMRKYAGFSYENASATQENQRCRGIFGYRNRKRLRLTWSLLSLSGAK